MKTHKIMAGPRDGEVRCMACFSRFRPQPGTQRTACPRCGMQWRISWPYPRTAKLRGPVWETFSRQHGE
jgi:rRNA maturation endonuclease Nob1